MHQQSDELIRKLRLLLSEAVDVASHGVDLILSYPEDDLLELDHEPDPPTPLQIFGDDLYQFLRKAYALLPEVPFEDGEAEISIPNHQLDRP